MGFRTSLWCLAACVVLAGGSRVGAAVPSNDRIYPNSTKAFISVPNVKTLTTSWESTLLYQLSQDPVMKPFAEDLKRQLQDKWLAKHSKVGVSLEDLQGIATGELSGALVGTPSGKGGLVVLVDVTGNEAKAKEVLDKAAQNLIKEGAKKSQKKVGAATVTIYDIPAKGDRHDPQRVAHFLTAGLLATGDNVEVLGEILARIDGKHNDTLATLTPYQYVMKRLAAAAGELKPEVRWFIDPLAAAEYRAIGDEKQIKNVKMLRNQGFGAVQGLGGFVNLSVGQYELLHRTAIYAPKPFEKAMGMFDLPNTAPWAPPSWVPRDVVSYTGINWNLKTAFEKSSTLFNELIGEGASEDVFEETLESIKTDPNGPGVDIRADLVAHLGTHATLITDFKLPITPNSERFVIAVQTTNERALAETVRRSLETDPNVVKRVFQDFIIWEMKAEEDTLAAPVIEHPDLVAATTAGGSAAAGKPADEPKHGKLLDKIGEDGAEHRQLPNAAVAVAHGHMFVSSHVDFLEKILAGGQDRRLENDLDFQRVNEELKKLGANEICVRNFTRTDEQFHITYDLFKAGQLHESQTVLAQLLRSATTDEDGQPKYEQPKLDGSKLPDYQVARRYLGVGGTYVATENNGWVIVGFLFRKEQ